jgi:hypothetical protein
MIYGALDINNEEDRKTIEERYAAVRHKFVERNFDMKWLDNLSLMDKMGICNCADDLDTLWADTNFSNEHRQYDYYIVATAD